jgi:hypothetical protein
VLSQVASFVLSQSRLSKVVIWYGSVSVPVPAGSVPSAIRKVNNTNKNNNKDINFFIVDPSDWHFFFPIYLNVSRKSTKNYTGFSKRERECRTMNK